MEKTHTMFPFSWVILFNSGQTKAVGFLSDVCFSFSPTTTVLQTREIWQDTTYALTHGIRQVKWHLTWGRNQVCFKLRLLRRFTPILCPVWISEQSQAQQSGQTHCSITSCHLAKCEDHIFIHLCDGDKHSLRHALCVSMALLCVFQCLWFTRQRTVVAAMSIWVLLS